jgi:hypothetical protein
MAGGFEVNPEPLNPEPVNGYQKVLASFIFHFYISFSIFNRLGHIILSSA